MDHHIRRRSRFQVRAAPAELSAFVRRNITVLECTSFHPINIRATKCGCGKIADEHDPQAPGTAPPAYAEAWTPEKHLVKMPSDAYGVIDFKESNSKAFFCRMSDKTEPSTVIELLRKWGANEPSLLISIHGGRRNFPLQARLKRVFRRGLKRVGRTTSAWVFTMGENSGVVRHVGDALSLVGTNESKIFTVGILPWGTVGNRNQFLTHGSTVTYTAPDKPSHDQIELNPHHSAFLFIDNGRVGRSSQDGEIEFRRSFEDHASANWRHFQDDLNLNESISLQRQFSGNHNKGIMRKPVPVIYLVLEGGIPTIKTVVQCMKQSKQIPVIVCKGSGRAADLLSDVYEDAAKLDLTMTDDVEKVIRHTAANLLKLKNQTNEARFQVHHAKDYAEILVYTLAHESARNLVTIFRMTEGQTDDLDLPIMAAVLKTARGPRNQLSCTIEWDRVDLAEERIFSDHSPVPLEVLHEAMDKALELDRVEFVALLMKNGVNMTRYLNKHKLLRLYNLHHDDSLLLRSIAQHVLQSERTFGFGSAAFYRFNSFSYLELGKIISHLIGGGFRSNYCASSFYHPVTSVTSLDVAQSRRTVGPGLPRAISFNVVGRLLTRAEEAKREVAAGQQRFSLDDLDTPPAPVPEAPPEREGESNNQRRHRRRSSMGGVPSAETTAGAAVKDSLDTMRVDPLNQLAHPFSDLMVWAVMFNRFHMAELFWKHGEEALAKSLIAAQLYRGMAIITKADMASEVYDRLKQHKRHFREMALALLEECYQYDDQSTCQLLTAKMVHWSSQTCMRLAVLGKHKNFVAHACCQNLLSDLWVGGLRTRSCHAWKVVLGLIMPPYIFRLDFMTAEELRRQPQTEEDGNELRRAIRRDSSIDEEDDEHDAGGVTSPSLPPEEEMGVEMPQFTSPGTSDQTPSSWYYRMASVVVGNRLSSAPASARRTLSYSVDDRADMEMTGHTTLTSLNVSGQRDSGNGNGERRVRFRCGDEEDCRDGENATEDVTTPLQSSEPRSEGITRSQSLLPKSTIPFVDDVLARKNKHQHGVRLSARMKIYEFYRAPVTKYWCHSLAYFFFLVMYSLMVTLHLPRETPTWMEIYAAFFIFTWACDKVRECASEESVTFRGKVTLFFLDAWNYCDISGIISFTIGYSLRWGAWDNQSFQVGRLIMTIAVVFFYLHLLDMFAVNSHLGPYVTMITKMVYQLFYFMSVLAVVVASCGLILAGIREPNRHLSIDLLKDVFFQPYFMLYGEVFADSISPECLELPYYEAIDRKNSSSADHPICLPGAWLVPVVMTVYLLVANILLINLLIAVFNHIFDTINKVSKTVWKFQRYRLVIDHENLPILPPPLIIISHVWSLVRLAIWMCRRSCCSCVNCHSPRRRVINDNELSTTADSNGSQVQDSSMFRQLSIHVIECTLMLHLNPHDLEMLGDMEEACLDQLLRRKSESSKNSLEKVTNQVNERIEALATLVERINTRQIHIMQAQESRSTTVDSLNSQLEAQSGLLMALCRKFDVGIDDVKEHALQSAKEPTDADNYTSTHKPNVSVGFLNVHPSRVPPSIARSGNNFIEDISSRSYAEQSTAEASPAPTGSGYQNFQIDIVPATPQSIQTDNNPREFDDNDDDERMSRSRPSASKKAVSWHSRVSEPGMPSDQPFTSDQEEHEQTNDDVEYRDAFRIALNDDHTDVISAFDAVTPDGELPQRASLRLSRRTNDETG